MLFDHDAEEAILGLCLTDSIAAKICSERLAVEAIASEKYRSIYSTILSLLSGERAIDVVTVCGALRENGLYDRVDGKTTVCSLIASSGSIAGLQTYISSVNEKYKRRLLIDKLKLMNKVAQEGDELAESQADEIMDLVRSIPQNGHRRSKLVDMKTLMKEKPNIPWIIKPYIAKGDLAVMGAIYSTGKTWVAMDLAISICTGRPFLGEYPQTTGPVLIVDSENPLHLLHTRLSLLYHEVDADGSRIPPPGLHIAHMPNWRLDTQEGMTSLRECIEDIMPALIVLDTLSKFHSKNEDKASEMNPIMVGLMKLAREFGCAILVLHHEGKDHDGTRSAASRLRGSTAIGDSADQTFSLQKTSVGLKFSHNKSRHSASAGNIVFFLDDTGVSVSLNVLERNAKENIDIYVKFISEFIRSQEQPPTRGGIVEYFQGKNPPISKSTIDRALEHMERSNLIKKLKKSKDGVRIMLTGASLGEEGDLLDGPKIMEEDTGGVRSDEDAMGASA